jgi:hypothetical protein
MGRSGFGANEIFIIAGHPMKRVKKPSIHSRHLQPAAETLAEPIGSFFRHGDEETT